MRVARRMKTVPIVTDDYADAALEQPSVARAVAVRLLDLDNPTDPPAAAGHVTIFVADAAGNACSQEVKDEVVAMMMGDDRPLAVTVHVGDPTYTDVLPEVSIRLDIGADYDATVAAAEQALSTWLDKAVYDVDDSAPGRWRPPRNDAERVITEYDVAATVDDVDGVKAVTAATINPAGWFATGSGDKTVRVWNPQGKVVLTLPQTGKVKRVLWRPYGKLYVLVEGERALRVWHMDELTMELAALGIYPALP